MVALHTRVMAKSPASQSNVWFHGEQNKGARARKLVLLEQRADCNNPCGWYGQLCCETGQTCFTDANNNAQCGGQGSIGITTSGGYWGYYTNTYTEADGATKTTVFSSFKPVGTLGTSASCNYAQNESPCGSICCQSGQYCIQPGQCVAATSETGSTTRTGPNTTTTSRSATSATSSTSTVPSSSSRPPNNSSDTPQSGSYKKVEVKYIVPGVVVGVIVLIGVAVFIWYRRSRAPKNMAAASVRSDESVVSRIMAWQSRIRTSGNDTETPAERRQERRLRREMEGKPVKLDSNGSIITSTNTYSGREFQSPKPLNIPF